jgi:hypothetical protein
MKQNVAQALQWPRAWVVDPDFAAMQYSTAPFGPMLDTWPGYLSPFAIPHRILRGHALLTLEILRAGTSDVWGVDPLINVKRKKIDVLETEFYDRHLRRTGLRVFPSVWREMYPLTLASEPASVRRA